VTRTWTATDTCGNTSTASQTINVEDKIAPVITALPAESTISCPAEPVFAQAIATDNCGSDFTLTSNDVTTPGACAGSYSVTRTWTAIDACGNASTASQTINIEDKIAPVIAVLPPESTISCPAMPVFAQATAIDNCNSAFTLTSNDITTPGTCTGAYSVTRIWTATDACGNTSTASQTINIEDKTAPDITSQATNITVECDGSGNQNAITAWLANNGGATATDTCSDVTWSNDFNALSNDCSTAVTVIFTATDQCGNKATTSATFSVQDNTAPVVPQAPANETVACASSIPVAQTLTTIDNCNGQMTAQGVDSIAPGNCPNSFILTRTWTFTDACNNTSSVSQTITVDDEIAPVAPQAPAAITVACAGDVPANISLTAVDNCSGDITVQGIDTTVPGNCPNSFIVTRTWTFTDACNNATSISQTINVTDTVAPIIAELPAESTISCPAAPEFAQATATDNCGSDFTLTSADVKTDGACADSYSVTRTWTATDACGNTSTASQTINVQDVTAPVIAELPVPSTISCPATPAFAVATATDACGSDFTLTSVDVTTNGACAGSYSVTRTWTATDACGNTSTASQTINVTDTVAPVIADLPEPSTISCPATPVFAVATATDACGSDFTLTSADVKTDGACASSYSVTRTWTATDACGNIATASQTINVTDTVAPVIAALPEPSTISCPATPAFAVATATDACGSDFTLTSADVKTDGDCAGSYSVTRTWTATDACGNTATASQTINVQDLVGPTTTTDFAPSMDVQCDAIPSIPELVFVDNCSTVNTPVYTESIINQTPTSYSIVREWNVADACGNSSKFVQVINVTIANSGIIIQESACNADSTPIDLNSFLPAGTPTNGIWINTDNVGILQGSIFNPLDASLGDHIFEYNVTDGSCPLNIKINMNINFDCKVLGCEAVVVHNAFTPNGDGTNEQLVIDGVEDSICYPSGINIEIYNRWGVLVFETSKYNNTTNNFDGYSRGRTTIRQSDGLPTGTYYYILNYESFDSNNNIQINKKDGFIYLSK
jgi:gliding motility-associated-like protein